jgi:hypothetical protein
LAAGGLQRLPPLQRRQDRVQDPLNVAVDVAVLEANHPIAQIAQEVFSLRIATALIVGRMSRAVDLDDKFFLTANEVGKIGTDRLLPNELEPAEKAVSKSPPEQTFSPGVNFGGGLALGAFPRGAVRA